MTRVRGDGKCSASAALMAAGTAAPSPPCAPVVNTCNARSPWKSGLAGMFCRGAYACSTVRKPGVRKLDDAIPEMQCVILPRPALGQKSLPAPVQQLTKPPPMSTVSMAKPSASPASHTSRAWAMAAANAAGLLAPLPYRLHGVAVCHQVITTGRIVIRHRVAASSYLALPIRHSIQGSQHSRATCRLAAGMHGTHACY